MRKTIEEFNAGKSIPGKDWQNGCLDFFGDVVWPMARQDRVTRQASFRNFLDFDGDVFFTRTQPLEFKSGEELHLQRPPDTRQGRRQSDIERLDNAIDQQRITAIRRELSTL